jgi:hypothetical protein
MYSNRQVEWRAWGNWPSGRILLDNMPTLKKSNLGSKKSMERIWFLGRDVGYLVVSLV